MGTEFTLGTSKLPYMLYTPCEPLVSGRTEVTDSSKKATFSLHEIGTYRAQVENFLPSATGSLAAGRLCPATYNGCCRAGLELCHRGCGGRGAPRPTRGGRLLLERCPGARERAPRCLAGDHAAEGRAFPLPPSEGRGSSM